ncbi:PH domain-containing protein [Cytobacillus sp. IB215316]|uniref:PH domain-containing protein n=1 Tax=Cytobacillus sp. IB215316 TaxID=3097354 RepID=UPI002A0AF471|nr:PH domain-containing protein [Cytobacillus sp. IB215316]MDX8360744.1 PH domain-containing protein [Cytobacillus sp. IB215316]
MFNKNQYFNNHFKELLTEEETYNHYFYVMSMAPLTKYLMFQQFAVLMNKHMAVSFTNKRIIICEMDSITGKFTEGLFDINLSDVKNVSLKKGLLKTKINITFSDDSGIMLKPNNFCIGLSNHKQNLTKLMKLYQ